jgi:hypothetical protein
MKNLADFLYGKALIEIKNDDFPINNIQLHDHIPQLMILVPEIGHVLFYIFHG